MMVTTPSLSKPLRLLTKTATVASLLLVLFYQFLPMVWTDIDSSIAPERLVEFLFHIVLGPVYVFTLLKLVEWWWDHRQYDELQTYILTRRLASILSFSIDAIISTDDQGRIVTWNLGAEQLFGYAADEAVGCPFSALLGVGRAADVEARWLMDSVRASGFVRRHETTCHNVSGRELEVELTATLLQGDQGEPAGMSIIVRDMTDRNRREAEARYANATLNQQAANKAYELAEKIDQLARANAELKQLDQTRSEFVSLVSHQIRAPLTNMAGAVQRMQADCPAIGPTCIRMFAIFEQQVVRLNRLVQDVLNATLIEAGELFLQLEPISVFPVIRQAVQQICARTPARPIHFSDKPGLPLVYADRDRVAEILSNLLDNADKYTPPDKDIFIDVRANQSEVTIAVRDSGPGLSASDLERIFGKFYRSDSSDSQPVYGYGLGLYVCRLLVATQNGRIWAENHPAGGAVFSFSLPVWEG